MVGASPAIRGIIEQIDRVATTKATVLVRGESGSGKELVARAIHEASDRRGGPCICLNCAALAETLLESELFGHEKGAFTGATEKKIGKFEAADRGTLILDEIGEMPSAPTKDAANEILPNGCSAVVRTLGAVCRPPSCFEYGTQSPVFWRM